MGESKMEWWDHTKPFPDEMRTGCPDSDEIREMIWKWGPELYAEKQRDARIDVLRCRAAGHDIGFAKAHDLYAQFPELHEMERQAEASFQAIQRSGAVPPALYQSCPD